MSVTTHAVIYNFCVHLICMTAESLPKLFHFMLECFVMKLGGRFFFLYQFDKIVLVEMKLALA